MDVDFAKAHVSGHSRGQVYVRPYERGGVGAPPPPQVHPASGDKGEDITIKNPTQPSAPSTCDNVDAVANFTPGGDVPRAIGGVPVRRWRDHSATEKAGTNATVLMTTSTCRRCDSS